MQYVTVYHFGNFGLAFYEEPPDCVSILWELGTLEDLVSLKKGDFGNW